MYDPPTQPRSAKRGLVIALGLLALAVGGFYAVAFLGHYWWEEAFDEQEAARAFHVKFVPGESANSLETSNRGRGAREASEAAEVFFRHLHAGEIDTAYDLTTERFRAATSRAQFRALIERHPNLRSEMRPRGTMPSRKEQPAEVRFRLVSSLRTVRTEVELSLLEAADRWRIDEIVVREDPVR